MKNFFKLLCVVFVTTWIMGCDYNGIAIRGYYYVSADRPVRITYTNEYGKESVIVTKEFSYSFNLPDETEIFYHKVLVHSFDGEQRIYVNIWFTENNNIVDEVNTIDYSTTDLNSELYYCVPWSTSCDTFSFDPRRNYVKTLSN